MNLRATILGGVLVAGLVALGWYWRNRSAPSAPTGSVVLPDTDASAQKPIPVRPDSELPYNPSQFNLTLDQSIQVFEERVRDDPQNHLNLTNLAGLYVRKARQDGDLAAYDKAEAAFQRALKAVPNHTPARLGLALTASARHQFKDALRMAAAVLAESPGDLDALVIVGDARLELGQYAEAKETFRTLEEKASRPSPPPVLARMARIAELHGNPDEAVRLLQQAIELQRDDFAFAQSGAWYSMRLGDVLFSQGKYSDAATRLEAALVAHPRYPAALALLARTRAAQGRTDDAIELFKRAMKFNPDLSVLSDLGDLYIKTGNDFLAKTLHDSVEKIAKDKPEYDRELALYYCNHSRELPKALELARRDLTTRQDIFAFDTLAWALSKNGQPREAEQAMNQALKLGTRDASFYYHAGVIAEQLGDRSKARDYLKRALALNPQFSPTQADEARQRLAKLGDQ